MGVYDHTKARGCSFEGKYDVMNTADEVGNELIQKLYWNEALDTSATSADMYTLVCASTAKTYGNADEQAQEVAKVFKQIERERARTLSWGASHELRQAARKK